MKSSQTLYKEERKGNPLIWLIVIYLAGVVFRFAIGFVTSRNPFVMPDEVLYSNIARSLISGDGVSLRNQSITYTNLLYPILISPIYAFARAGAQFRMILFFNAVVMNLAIFPTYQIARRFTENRKAIWAISVISIMIPDMVMANRVMTEAVVYPLFLAAVLLVIKRLAGEHNTVPGALFSAAVLFLLVQAKSGSVALAVVFVGILVFDLVKPAPKKPDGITHEKPSAGKELRYILVFAGTFIGLFVLARIVNQSVFGMDFSLPSIYQTQTKLPTLDHLKKTLPGLLLYFFFVPVAMGVFPMLLPACNLRAYPEVQRRQARFILISLVLYMAGACYMFFDQETIGNFYQGRIHIRYVFMFLPLLLILMVAPAMEKARINGKLVAATSFLAAMTMTVSFSALLSNRIYCVDALSLSYLVYDDSALNLTLFAQIAFIVFMVIILWQMRAGWNRKTAAAVIVCLCAGIAVNNFLGYNLNSHNNSNVLSADVTQSATLLAQKTAVLVPDDDIYFSNALSVLDCAMTDAPYVIKLEDLCAGLGDYGEFISMTPPQYWTENPSAAIPFTDTIVLNSHAFYRTVLADGVNVTATDNGYYGIVTLSGNHLLFHSALTGVDYNGTPRENATLYVYDPELLAQDSITLYLQVSADNGDTITLSAVSGSMPFAVAAGTSWIQAIIAIPEGTTTLPVSIDSADGDAVILTYSIE
jgi:hypothetical protein